MRLNGPLLTRSIACSGRSSQAPQRVAELLPRIVAVLVNQAEQIDDAAGSDLRALPLVDPDALARKTEVELDDSLQAMGETFQGKTKRSAMHLRYS